MRVLQHLCTPRWLMRRHYPADLLARIAERIGQIERAGAGELRFVVEHALDLGDLLAGLSPRERALELFGLLRVWDTEHNSGVLVYVLHAEHAVEIVADRGIARLVAQHEWDGICRQMETAFRAGRHAQGVMEAIDHIARLLERHAPARAASRNELPDQPLLL